VNLMEWELIERKDLERTLGQIEVFHITSHGRFGDTSPYRSGVYLDLLGRPEALWSVADIFSNVDSPAGRLAVLSACATGGTTPNLVSEEVSLPAAFVAAGYAAVIGSRWPVDDLSTTLLMGKFYRRWFEGDVGVAQALDVSRRWLRDLGREEAAELLRALPDQLELPDRAFGLLADCENAADRIEVGESCPFSNPRHWAAFFVVGDGSITSNLPDKRIPNV